MENGYIILVCIEIGILITIILCQFIHYKLEQRKVNKILKFFEKYKNKHSNKQLKDCINIIEQNKKGKINNGN